MLQTYLCNELNFVSRDWGKSAKLSSKNNHFRLFLIFLKLWLERTLLGFPYEGNNRVRISFPKLFVIFNSFRMYVALFLHVIILQSFPWQWKHPISIQIIISINHSFNQWGRQTINLPNNRYDVKPLAI